jgi:hypothetical protein
LAEAIDSLCAAAQASGAAEVPRLLDADEQIGAQATVCRIKEALGTLGLPVEIEWFWTTWNSSSFGLLTGHPGLTDPGFALDVLEDDDFWPHALLPVAYESHCFLAVELEYSESPGAWVFDYCYADDGFRLRVSSFAAIFEIAAATFLSGDVIDHGRGILAPGESIDSRYLDERMSRRLAAEHHGPFDPMNILEQPARWLRARGLDESSLAVKGATHTIAELAEAQGRTEVRGTIVGEVVPLIGIGSGELELVRDETGVVVVWVPGSVPRVGSRHDGVFEYDVVAQQSDAPKLTIDDVGLDHAALLRRALAGDVVGAGALGVQLSASIDDHPIVATAVRRTEPQ